jgi:hypothetical protein
LILGDNSVAATSTRYTTKPRRRDISPERNRSNVPTWAHPEYKYYFDEWKIIRDTCEGEKDVKGEKENYLPRLEGMELGEYKVYLHLACFYNFTGRTAGALVGTLLRKKPIVDALPKDLVPKLQAMTQDSESWDCFVERATDEYVKMRRYGVLVDLPAVSSTEPNPYLVEYVAEDILDWEEDVDPVTGRRQLTRVVLREWKEVRQLPADSTIKVVRYRVLTLVDGVYRVALHAADASDATLQTPPTITTPQIRGNTLNYIPFCIIGRSRVVKSGLNDIARLNLSHYNSYAILEHARFYTGLPVYFAETDGEGETEYVLAPNRVWEVQKGCRAGVIEFNGQGLKFLENALEQKEAQAAALGGRMIGVSGRSVSETDNQSQMKDRNEQAILLQNARALEEAATFVLRTWARFNLVPDADVAKIEVEYNKDFLYSAIGSREFRAIQSMYQAGALPVEVLYDYMLKAEVIPESLTLDEFKTLLNTGSSFPNQPDFEARKEGYANALSRTQAQLKEGDQEIAQEEADTAAAAAKAAAKQAARPPASPVGTPPGPRQA